ncbi:MAG: GNAT family N-acetyltransferase [Treponema sp.]
MENFTVRRCTPADTARIMYIGELTFRETFADTNTPDDMEDYVRTHFCENRVAEELSAPFSHVYVAECGTETAAYMKLNFPPAQTETGYDGSLEIQRLYVAQKYKRMHIGSALMRQAFAAAQDAALDYIWLGVWEHNAAAQAFYARHGFTRFGEHDFILGADVQTDYLMKAPTGTRPCNKF